MGRLRELAEGNLPEAHAWAIRAADTDYVTQGAYAPTMAHLSNWHRFDSNDRKTYPKVDAPIQVRFDDGQMEEGDTRMYFPEVKLLPISSINAWRYIKAVV